MKKRKTILQTLTSYVLVETPLFGHTAKNKFKLIRQNKQQQQKG